ETLTSDPHISAPAEAADRRFQSAQLFLFILAGECRIGSVGLHIFDVALDLTHRGVALVGSLLRRRSFALRLGSVSLVLLHLMLRLLPGGIALLQLIHELLDLLLLRRKLVFQGLQIALRYRVSRRSSPLGA